MDSLWIVHDEAPARAAIARLAGCAPSFSGTLVEAGAGVPADVAPPDTVILGVGPRRRDTLAIALRIAERHPDARWLLIHPAGLDPARLAREFARLAPELLRWPPPAGALRRVLAHGGSGGDPGAASLLASRRQRDALVRRFTRAFGDLDLPNPIGNGAPLLVTGEVGTGRLLLARVVHSLAERSSTFLHVACGGGDDLTALKRRLDSLAGAAGTVCVEHPEALTRSAQRELCGWVELGPPLPALDADDLRWIAIVDETAAENLDPELERALSGLEIRIPPLRERPGAAERFAEGWLADQAHAHDAPVRELADDARAALAADAWPGNLRELEEALRRATAVGAGESISAADLGANPGPDAALFPGSEPAASQIAQEPASVPGPAAAMPGEPETRPRPPRRTAVQVPQLARTLSHELRNPMVSLRTFANLLPERHADPVFQDEFRFQMERDLLRIESRLERLREYSELRPAEAKPVDVSALVEGLLDERRATINQRSLLVLRELEDERPHALGDPDRLRFALAALLDAAFDAVADRADLYVACRYHPRGLDERPAMRVLVRFHAARAPALLPGEDGDLELSLLLARETLEALGGHLTVDSTEADERVLLVDLPAA